MSYSPYTLHCATPFPQNLPLAVAGLDRHLWPTRPTTANDIPIESAVFPQYKLVNMEIDRYQQAAHTATWPKVL